MNGKTRHKKIWLKTWAFNVLSAFRHTTILKIKLLSIYQEETTQSFFWYYYFLNVGLLKESIFLTTFYGLYFSHQYTNITNYIFSWYRPSVGSFSCTAYIHLQIQSIQLLIFTEKISPLPGFEPRTSPVTSWYATNWTILAWINK